jgi:DNA-binding NarL/FixJ family response regulator
MTEERRCLIIDGHPVVRHGIRELLAGSFATDEAGDLVDGLGLLAAVGGFDVAVIELRHGNGSGTPALGAAAIAELRRANPGLGIVAHGAHPDRHVATDALRAGATAYVAKTSPVDSLVRAVDAAAEAERFVDPATDGTRGRAPLTRRQRQILQLIADGQSTDRVAKGLGLSNETVRTHTKAILARLGARDRAHAVAKAIRAGLIE